MYNHFIVNPAYAGSRDVLNASTVLRYQWLNVKGAPRTQTLNISAPIRKKKIGVGLNLVNDELGPKKTTTVLLSYAYHIRFRRSRLSFGLRGGASMYRFNSALIDYKDQQDPYNNGQTFTKTLPTFDAGAYYYTRNSYISLAATHLFSTKYNYIQSFSSSSKLQPHIFFAAGRAFDINQSLILNPSFMIRATAGAPLSFDINLNARIEEKLWIGVSYRKSVGIVFLTQVAITNNFKFGYSFDWGQNKFGTVAGSTHEVYLGYDINVLKSKILSTRYL